MSRSLIQLSGQFVKTFSFSNKLLFLNNNIENYFPKRWAGHSKWQNIKSTKEANDKIKSATFQRLARLMINAVKEKGDNPLVNHKLKMLLDEAQKENMPKSSIEKAIKSSKSEITEKPYWTVFSGPKNLVMALEVTFANKKSAFILSKVGSLTKKLKLKHEPHFSHLCCEKGLIISDPPLSTENSYDKAVEDGIEIGVDEVFENSDKSLTFECLSDRVDSLAKKLLEKGYKVISASVELNFNNVICISDEEMKNVESLISKLQEQNAEIIRIIHNAELE